MKIKITKMFKKCSLLFLLLSIFTVSITACKAEETKTVSKKSSQSTHGEIAQDLMAIFEDHPELKGLFEKSIKMAKEINPDKQTNPAQTLDEYYDFLDWAEKPMPWNVIKDKEYPSIFESIDQGLDYFYFILDQPLEELEDKGYYYNSLQYVEEIQPWLVKYSKAWGEYLSTEDSWNEEYLEAAKSEARFNLDKGWYEDSSNWKSFNDFFSRKLSSPEVRPIAEPENDAVVAAPADSQPQGVWKIDEDSNLVQKDGVVIKSTAFNSIEQLVGKDSEYKDAFAGGLLTHTFLNVDDYHRYHFPMSGTVKEVRIVPDQDAIGGITTWDSELNKYILTSDTPGWQSIETRGCVILETEKYGLVALLPIAMSQVSSVNFGDNIKAGVTVKKGDELGYFLFGGSDYVILFQKGVNFQLTVEANDSDGGYEHVYMGETYGILE